MMNLGWIRYLTEHAYGKMNLFFPLRIDVAKNSLEVHMSRKEFLQAISDAVKNLDEKTIKEVKLGMNGDCKRRLYNRLNMIAYEDRK